MLNKDGIRELVYLGTVTAIRELPGYDRVESACVNNGWWCIVPKGQFSVGTIGIYFEIDSLVPASNPVFAFMDKRNYKVKTQKMCKTISQGLLMHPSDFGWTTSGDTVIDDKGVTYKAGDFLTEKLGVKYAEEIDNKRKAKADPNAKYKSMMSRHPKFAKTKFARWCMKRTWAKKILYVFLGKKKVDNAKAWPTGRFPGVSKTDQERIENMTWVLEDKTPFIVTQKCDGSSGTYILERKGKKKFEFYVCSRNVRMASKEQECFYGEHNYYWEAAELYNIEKKMQAYLEANPDLTFVCWQGEVCAPGIQANPHKLTKTHFYCFHWTDNNGRKDIRDAAKIWKEFNMEVVPIVGEIVLPDDFEEFKLSSEGMYDASVCEGKEDCMREGLVYYSTTNPSFSFKNVSRSYLAKH